MIDASLRKIVSEYRTKLEPIVDTIKLCHMIGIAFGGYKDDSRYHPDVGKYSDGGVGNFIELLNFFVIFGRKLVVFDNFNVNLVIFTTS